jgi:hypothetical protein
VHEIAQVGEESDSSGSERSPKQAKRRNRGSAPPATRRRKSGISARERNLRRLESNERERMRMHSLNDAFEVTVHCFLALSPYRVDDVRAHARAKEGTWPRNVKSRTRELTMRRFLLIPGSQDRAARSSIPINGDESRTRDSKLLSCRETLFPF